MTDTASSSRHTLATRLFHAGLAIAVVVQLLTSLGMEPPRGGTPANTAFQLHAAAGVAALVFVLAFWITAIVRIAGTDAGALFPWASGLRLAALRDDLVRHWTALRRLRLPAYGATAPFASAIHGLGLLLMTYMGLSGTMFLVAQQAGYAQSAVLHLEMEFHALCGNLVWAYLIGHAGMALLHHFTDHLSVREMWSFQSDPERVEVSK